MMIPSLAAGQIPQDSRSSQQFFTHWVKQLRHATRYLCDFSFQKEKSHKRKLAEIKRTAMVSFTQAEIPRHPAADY
jgi:hypothetical protein